MMPILDSLLRSKGDYQLPKTGGKSTVLHDISFLECDSIYSNDRYVRGQI